MNNIDEKNTIDFWKKFQEIRYDMSKANLEDVKNILDHYNQESYIIDGVNYHYKINPLDAACLNARYKQLTGEDHPTFIMEQSRILEQIIKSDEGLKIDGKPTIYQRLKNNLTGMGLGINILSNLKDSYIEKFEKIKLDISKASFEDVKVILDYYDQDSVLINGMQYHFRPNPLEATSLNARYKQLTGQEHPTFIEVQREILKEKNDEHQGIKVDGNLTVYEQLKNNSIAIENSNHIITNSQTESLEDISLLLNNYNGKPILIDGVVYHPLNDPKSAAKLNAKYHELTGHDHPMFIEQAPKVIDGLMKDKDMLIQSGAYDNSYFDTLEQIKQEIEKLSKVKSDEDRKKVFIEERDKQRQIDSSVRVQQIDAMKKTSQSNNEIQQIISDSTNDNSIGSMSK